MKSLVLLIFGFFMVKPSAQDYGLSDVLFNRYVDNMYKTMEETEDNIFIRELWPKIEEFLPASPKVPALEFHEDETHEYVCGTETKMWPKFKDVFCVGRSFDLKKHKMEFEIYAHMLLDDKGMPFKIAFKKADESAIDPIPVNLLYPGRNLVKFVFELFDFLGDKPQDMTAKCLVTIKDVQVTELGDIMMKNCPENNRLEKNKSLKQYLIVYWYRMARYGAMKEAMSAGLVWAITQHLQKTPEFWICASDNLKTKSAAYEKKHQYTEKYSKYCGGERVN